jgi:hypothetical protein
MTDERIIELMDRHEILRLARAVGVNVDSKTIGNLKMFVQLVALSEREACAKVCDDIYAEAGWHPLIKSAAKNCGSAIRERSMQMQRQGGGG